MRWVVPRQVKVAHCTGSLLIRGDELVTTHDRTNDERAELAGLNVCGQVKLDRRSLARTVASDDLVLDGTICAP